LPLCGDRCRHAPTANTAFLHGVTAEVIDNARRLQVL
jgi:hypothetical protein